MVTPREDCYASHPCPAFAKKKKSLKFYKYGYQSFEVMIFRVFDLVIA